MLPILRTERYALPNLKTSLTLLVVAAVTSITPSQRCCSQSTPVGDAQIKAAIEKGMAEAPEKAGLHLIDKWTAIRGAYSGFSIDIYTPSGWIEYQAAEAHHQMKGFSSSDVTEDMKRDVVRVVAHPSTPMMVTASGVASASNVDHVVMQDSAKKSVIQPVTEDALDRIVASAISSQLTMHGQTAEFATEDFRKIRGEGGNAEFFVTVIGPKEQKDFKVKTKDFEKL